MRLASEQRWVALLNSPAWRRIGNSGFGRQVIRSKPFQTVDTTRRYAETMVSRVGNPTAFRSVGTFCVFLGTVKSGGTLLGSLLDAHPRIVLADEADAFRYVGAGFRREQLFHLLAKSSRRAAMKGRVTARRLESYSLAVPGQWQGRSDRPLVVGDSRAGPTTRRLGEQPELLERLGLMLGDVQDRYIHVIRDPYDPISAMVLRGQRSLPDAIEDYVGQSRRLAALRPRLRKRLLTVWYEDLLADPASELARVCRFLGVEPDEEYLAACTAIVDPGRPGERHLVDWPPSAIDAVQRLTCHFAFLHRYAYDGEARWSA